MRITRRRLIKRRANPEKKSGFDGTNKAGKALNDLSESSFFKGAMIGAVCGTAIGIIAKKKILLFAVVGFVAGGMVGNNIGRIIIEKDSNKTQFKKSR